MKDIVELDKDLYLVHGKVIRADTPGMFEGEGGRRELLEIADVTMVSKYWPEPADDLAAFGFGRLENDPDGATRGCFTRTPFSALPEHVRDILKKELPDRADKI